DAVLPVPRTRVAGMTAAATEATTGVPGMPDLDAEARREIRAYFARYGTTGDRARYPYYYDDLYGFVRSQVRPGSSVLDLGCGDGTLLASLRPARGVGVDV